MCKDRELYTADANRREVLRTAGASMIAGFAASGVALSGPAAAQAAPQMSPTERNNGPLGVRLQGIQHFGVTVPGHDAGARKPYHYGEDRTGTAVGADRQ